MIQYELILLIKKPKLTTMKKTLGPRAYPTNDGNLLCCLNDQFIYMTPQGDYYPAKIERKQLRPINNIEWSFAQTWGKPVIILTEAQVALAQKAFQQRQKFFEAKVKVIKFIDLSVGALFSLKNMTQDELFKMFMSWLKHFECSPENKKFRDKIGFVIAERLECLSENQQEEILKAFKNFNPNPAKELADLIRLRTSANYDAKVSSLKTFAHTVIGFEKLSQLRMGS